MADAWEAHAPEIVDLRQIQPGGLDALLDEETELWQHLLDWDFKASAALVRRFCDLQAHNGHAMVVNRLTVGYAYFVAEDRKGLIGENGTRKQAFSVLQEFYARKAAEAR